MLSVTNGVRSWERLLYQEPMIHMTVFQIELIVLQNKLRILLVMVILRHLLKYIYTWRYLVFLQEAMSVPTLAQ